MQDQIIISKLRKWWALGALSGALALAFLDQMNLPVALPTIQKELMLSTLTVQWLVNAYLLTWAVFVLTGGFLADYFGLRRIFCLGLAIFAIGSLACSFSFAGWWFLVFRATQGFGTALMLPAAIGIIVSIFPKDQQGKAIGIYSGFATIFLILGPVMGGVFTQFLSWRWIFWFNIPIAIFSFFVLLVSIPKILGEKKSFDFKGFLLFTLGFPCFILALMQANSWGWGSALTISLFGISIAALFFFFYFERKIKVPFLDFDLFKDLKFLVSNLIFFVIQFVLILPVFWAMSLQKLLLMSPLEAGLVIMVAVIPLIVVVPLGGLLSDITGTRFPVAFGLFLATIAMVWFFVFRGLSTTILIPGMIVFGCGVALVFAPISSCVVGGVPANKRGIASGILGCIRQVGGTFGMAVISAMLANIRTWHFFGNLKKNHPNETKISNEELECFYHGTVETLSNKLSPATIKMYRALALDSYTFAFKWIYLVCGVLMFIAFLLSLKAFSKKTPKHSK